jgi:hypothetical protein
MSLAGLDLLHGARFRLVAAALLAGCSGEDEVVIEQVPAPSIDAGADVSVDAPFSPDGAREGRADAAPRDGARSEGGRDAGSDGGVATEADAAKLALCLRLNDPLDTNRVLTFSQTVTDQFILFVYADCRVANAVHPPGGTVQFGTWKNEIYAYNLDLWGCTSKTVTDFELVSSTFGELTKQAAQALVDDYLQAATKILSLTDDEAADMRADLERLELLAVGADASNALLSTCASDAGSEEKGSDAAEGAADAPADAGNAAPDAADAQRADASRDAADVSVDGFDANDAAQGADTVDTNDEAESTADAADDTTDVTETDEGGD